MSILKIPLRIIAHLLVLYAVALMFLFPAWDWVCFVDEFSLFNFIIRIILGGTPSYAFAFLAVILMNLYWEEPDIRLSFVEEFLYDATIDDPDFGFVAALKYFGNFIFYSIVFHIVTPIYYLAFKFIQLIFGFLSILIS